MIVLVFKYLTPKWVRGITIFPFIVLSYKEDKKNLILINHEKIHIRQQIELLVIPFFLWYGLEFLVRLLQYRNSKEAYLNISFEREAYQNEKNLDYLKQRSFWDFIKFL
ncbi:hypothetical protein [uncultured Flavobacterium sp.]|uniref:hypothetical protein n=1 Tax=uncultured Flavobacterium sp. TaxID=165435 RepID=UPI0030ECF66C|tara:strand:- start:454 stop:780 length:327 start_codon:yes stop_codon:yes gene_type:complete